ncbi:MAG: RNA methyltransferase, partial [Clostridia bacterium]|nr:RNA methyltransferase [Clostridia bacterium]
VPAHVLETVSQVKTPQGIAVVSKIPAAAPLTLLGSRLLLLENVQDPGNVGTILRALDAAGFDGCILTPGCADPYSPKVLRATMGSVLRVPICFTENVLETLLELKESGYQTIASTLDGDPFYQRCATPEKLCLVIGNEGAGIALQTQAACSMRLKLPMRGGAESLNAAVAAAIMMYDFVNR